MRELSEKEIEIVVRAFKVFLKKIVKNSAIDFAKKVKSSRFTEVVYSDLVDEKVSLSMYDEDAFFNIENIEYKKLENIVSDPKLKKAIKNLKLEEKLLLYLTAEDFSAEEEVFEITTAPNDFTAVTEKLSAEGITFLEAGVQMVPSTYAQLDEKGAEKMERLIEKLEDLDDVSNIYHNWEE